MTQSDGAMQETHHDVALHKPQCSMAAQPTTPAISSFNHSLLLSTVPWVDWVQPAVLGLSHV